MENTIDFFEYPDLLPENIKATLDRFSEASDEDEYKVLRELEAELEKEGWTFEYYLTAEPWGLRPISEQAYADLCKLVQI